MVEYISNVQYESPGFNLLNMVDPFMKNRLTKMLYKKYHTKYDRSANNEAMQTIIINKISDMFVSFDEYYKFRNDLAESIDTKWSQINPANSFFEENLKLEDNNKISYYEKKGIEILCDQGNWYYYVTSTLVEIDKKALRKLMSEEARDILNSKTFKLAKELKKNKNKSEEDILITLNAYFNGLKEGLKGELSYQKIISNMVSYLSKAISIELTHLTRLVAYVLTGNIYQKNKIMTHEIHEDCLKCAEYYVYNLFNIERQVEIYNKDLEMFDQISKLSLIKILSFDLNEIKENIVKSKAKTEQHRSALLHKSIVNHGIKNLITSEDELFDFLNNEMEIDVFLAMPADLYRLRNAIASLMHLYKNDLLEVVYKNATLPINKEKRAILKFVLRPINDIEFIVEENRIHYGSIDSQKIWVKNNKLLCLDRINLLPDQKQEIIGLLDDAIGKYNSAANRLFESENKDLITNKYIPIYNAFQNGSTDEFEKLVLALDPDERARFKIFRQRKYDYYQSARTKYLELQSHWEKNTKLRGTMENISQKQDAELQQMAGKQEKSSNELNIELDDISNKIHGFVTELSANPSKNPISEINTEIQKLITHVVGPVDDGDLEKSDLPDAKSLKNMTSAERKSLIDKLTKEIDGGVKSLERGANRRNVLYKIANEMEKAESEKIANKIRELDTYISQEYEITNLLKKLNIDT